MRKFSRAIFSALNSGCPQQLFWACSALPWLGKGWNRFSWGTVGPTMVELCPIYVCMVKSGNTMKFKLNSFKLGIPSEASLKFWIVAEASRYETSQLLYCQISKIFPGFRFHQSPGCVYLFCFERWRTQQENAMFPHSKKTASKTCWPPCHRVIVAQRPHGSTRDFPREWWLTS